MNTTDSRFKSVPRRRESSQTLLLLLIVMITGCRDGLHNPDVMLERAYMLEQRGEVDEAIKCYNNTLRMLPEDDPRRATIHYDRGVAYGLVDKMADAIADYTEAIERDSDMAVAHTNRAACYANLGQFEKALADLATSRSNLIQPIRWRYAIVVRCITILAIMRKPSTIISRQSIWIR